MRAAQAGDRQALEDLLRLHYDRVFAICRRLTGNDLDAADTTQESMIALVRHLDRFDGRSRFSTWVYRVAVNTSLDELRRRRRRPEPMAPDDCHTSRLATGSSESEIDDRIVIDAAMRDLPAEFRAAVVLRDFCTMDYAEIAEVLEIPPGTVRSRIARGRALLAERLRGRGEPDVSGSRPTFER